MKHISRLLLMAATIASFGACDKVDDLPLHQKATPSLLTTSATTLAPPRADSGKSILTLNWTYPNHAAADPNSIKYIIDIDSAGKNFSSPLTKVVIGSLTTTYLAKDFNNFLLARGYTPAVPVDLDVRLTSSYGNNNERTSSNILKLKYTPYAIRTIVNYSFPKALRVAGNYQGWAPGTAPKIVDSTASGTTGTKYEGYINFTNASPEFKFVKGDDWPAGDFGGAGANKLGGGDNLKLTDGQGVYLIKANTRALTWSATKINSWGVIGSATPNGWNASTPMTLNADGTYSVTVALTGGNDIKFRANDAWDINFGDNKANGGPDNVPDYDSNDNIAIATSGTYVVTLDLSRAGNYYYTLRRL
ncbi:MAG: SusF/SusE family outer membrane protein [Segetibacter sp.]|nr:SusF/SusE family outer membrane protein [Segetibacter sp.]